MENFARFGTRLDDATRQTIERGRRVREAFKQPQYEPLPTAEQIAMLLAVTSGLFDDLSLEQVGPAGLAIREATVRENSAVFRRIEAGEALTEEDREALLKTARDAVEAAPWKQESRADGND